MSYSRHFCRVCQSVQSGCVYQVPEMMYGSQECFDYFFCHQCACLQLIDVPDNMSPYYPKQDYYSLQPLPPGSPRIFQHSMKRHCVAWHLSASSTQRFIARRLYKNKMIHLLALAGVNQQSRLLDVGSGGGHLLVQLADLGFRHLVGIDPYCGVERQLKQGVQIRPLTLWQEDGHFDCIMLNHSFEHMANPHEVLARLSDMLAPHHTIILRIPVIDSFAWESYGVHWYALDAPRHLMLFNREAVSRLAQQYNFRVEQCIDDSGVAQFHYSELYQQGISLCAYQRNKSHYQLSKARKKVLRRAARQLNTQHRGDQTCLLLRKM